MMELDRTYMYNEEEQRGALRYSIGVDWPEGRRRPGRPKTTWRRMVEDERREAGWKSWTTVRALAANRSRWKENVKALCALWHEEIFNK